MKVRRNLCAGTRIAAIVAGSAVLAPAVAWGTAGDLDPRFSGDGIVRDHWGEPLHSDGLSAAALQPDGKIVAVGSSGGLGNERDWTIARYNPNGSRDLSFDGDSGTGNGVVKVSFASGTTSENPIDVAIQPNGRIVAVGYYRAPPTDDSVALVRLMPNGTLDPSFDGDGGSGNGMVTTPISVTAEDDYAETVALQGNKIVIGGEVDGVNPGVDQDEDYDMFLARYAMADGTLDPTFDGNSGTGNGIVTTSLEPNTYDSAYDLRVTPRGILAAGETGDDPADNADFALARFELADGRLDTGFSGDGKVQTPIGPGRDVAIGVSVLPDGRIVAGGRARSVGGNTSNFALARYRPGGALDMSFDGPSGNGNGVVSSDLFSGSYDQGQAFVLGPGAKPILAGGSGLSTFPLLFDTTVARYRSGGRFDRTFNRDGRVKTAVSPGSDQVLDMLLQPNRRIVVAGTYADDFADPQSIFLVRYHGDEAPRTKITDGPRRVSGDRSPTFAFRTDMPARFQCSLDRRRFRRCRSPKTYRGLRAGRHRFRVRAVDSRGVKDRTPASRRFRISR